MPRAPIASGMTWRLFRYRRGLVRNITAALAVSAKVPPPLWRHIGFGCFNMVAALWRARGRVDQDQCATGPAVARCRQETIPWWLSHADATSVKQAEDQIRDLADGIATDVFRVVPDHRICRNADHGGPNGGRDQLFCHAVRLPDISRVTWPHALPWQYARCCPKAGP